MSEPATKTRAKGSPPAVQRAPAKGPARAAAGTRGGLSGLMQGAGPALGLGVQRQVAVGEPGDRFEREADTAADRVTNGESVDTSAISPVTPETLAQSAVQKAEEAKPQKLPEATTVQKAEANPEKKPEAVQKAEASPQEKPQAISEKKPDMPVQKAEAAPEKMPQAMPEKKPETPVQKTGTGPGSEEQKQQTGAVQKEGAGPAEEMPVQAEAAGGAPSPSAVASSAIGSKGVGKPLEPATRGTLESGLGADLGDVRVHDDGAAQASARALNARAFTHGNDIWLGQGASQSDTRLMAHEATHVVQQSGGAHRMVQRANGKGKGGSGGGGAKTPAVPGGGATVDHGKKTIDIPELQVPKYDRKAKAIPTPLPLPKNPTRPNDQRDVWRKGVLAAPGYATNVLKNVDRKRGVKSAKTGKMVHVLKPNASGTVLIGDQDTLPDKLALPRWNSSGKGSSYDVDHIREMQLGGDNVFGNMELLDSSANRSSGSKIHNEIVAKLGEAVKPEIAKGKQYRWMRDLKKVQSDYQVTFTTVKPALDVVGEPGNFWSRDAVTGGDQVKAMTTLSASEIASRHLIGDTTHLVVYPRPSGGTAKNIPWKPDANAPASFNGKGIFKNFEATGVTYTPGSGGTITGIKRFGKDLIEAKQITWKLNEMEGLDYTTYVDRSSVLQTINPLTGKGTSPIELGEIDLDDGGGLAARGVLRPNLPIFKGLELDLILDGDQLSLSKTFAGGEINFPGPVQVTGSSLTLLAGTGGFSITGALDFEIEKLGKGQISGEGSFGGESRKGLSIKGNFELDKKLFDGEARIEAGYKDDALWAKGHLSIGDGKIRGIKSASLDAEYGKDTFSAKGSVKPDIPAVEEAGLAIDYNPEIGLKFTGDLAIKADTPGIAGGSIHVEAMQPPGSDTFKVKGTGKAKPKIPGFDSELNVSYDDGTFDASITAAYNKGRLKGSVTLGATNRPVADGAPAGPAAAKAKDITIYGGGSVTVVIAPWLQGTVGVRLLPNGEIELSGEIGLPATVDIFPEKKLDKNIFKIGIDIPIVGVAVLGQRIGIFATISGGLDVSAGIGPGQLQQLRLKVTYNPAHEEDTHVEGDASLHVPAHAGLRLFVRGGIGAGIPIVSAEAGLEIGAALGLEGALDTGVHVDWTPTKGLVLDANASIYVEPKLKVDLSGYVDVSADLLLTTVDLYSKRWQLAAFEYGSNLRFGVSFPVHYDQDKGFDLSLDKLQFQVPDVDPKAILSDLIDKL